MNTIPVDWIVTGLALPPFVLGSALAAKGKKGFDFSRPRPAVGESGFVSHTEQTTVNTPPEIFYKWSSTTPLEKLATGAKNIPRVVSTEMIGGTWAEPGARRRVILDDGTSLAEEILDNEPLKRFRYQVWGYPGFRGYLIDYAIGEFRYEASADHVGIKWTYSFHRKFAIGVPLLSWFVNGDFAGFMRACLGTIKREAERYYTESVQ
ncbi:MAG TPA: SRPBCC family protein [Blastocatellia bacterium]